MHSKINKGQNISLLRAFDLEAAKAGELLCNTYGTVVYKLNDYTVRNSTGKVECMEVTEIEDGYEYEAVQPDEFRMQPLTWIEGKPVYKGDTLWYKGVECSRYIGGTVNGYNHRVEGNSGLEITIVKTSEIYKAVGELTWAPFDCWTWKSPLQKKVVKKVWINVYEDINCSCVHESKEDADEGDAGRIACVETTLEYTIDI